MFYVSDKWFCIFRWKLWRNFQLRTTFSILQRQSRGTYHTPRMDYCMLWVGSWDKWFPLFGCIRLREAFPFLLQHTGVILHYAQYDVIFFSKNGRKLNIWCLKRVIDTVIELFALVWFSQKFILFSTLISYFDLWTDRTELLTKLVDCDTRYCSWPFGIVETAYTGIF